MQINFFDFEQEIQILGPKIEETVMRVIRSGRYILGPELAAFEHEFAISIGAKHAIGVANGTDALMLALKAAGIGPGDEVITVANTFAATALAIAYTGATPVFVDIKGHLMDPAQLEAALSPQTRAIIPVHLYGQCAEMETIKDFAKRHELFVLEDACQAHGAMYRGQPAGTIGQAGAFSFYPTKNLGAYGDAGMIVTNDHELADKLRLLRNYGQLDRYHYALQGFNSRMDEIQAAILRLKLNSLIEMNGRRRDIGEYYAKALAEFELAPTELLEGSTHVYHLYVAALPERDRLREHLKERGVETLIHYPVPLHLQPSFSSARCVGDLPVTMERAGQIVSLPLSPWMSNEAVDYVIAAVRDFYR